MDFIPKVAKPAAQDFGTSQAIDNANHGSSGGALATALSAVALLFSFRRLRAPTDPQ